MNEFVKKKRKIWLLYINLGPKINLSENCGIFTSSKWFSYLRNVFCFNQIINIKENLYRNTKLEKVIDDLLHPVIDFHICWCCSLFLSQRSWTTFKYDFFNNSRRQKKSIWFFKIFKSYFPSCSHPVYSPISQDFLVTWST